MKISKPFLIAEIGINHNGDMNIAKQLITNAKKCGFDAVKFQKRDIYSVYSKEQLKVPRESPWGKTTEQQKQGLGLQRKHKKSIIFVKIQKLSGFITWDLKSVEFLKKFNCNYNKIASAMIVDKNFLNAIADQKKYTFISTGMSSKRNIDDAVEIFTKKNCKFELMHCISTYPMKPEDANLLTIQELKKIYKCDVGYSGHENGVAVSLAALSLGISSLERHIALDRSMYGSDQSASLEYSGMKSTSQLINF